MENNIDLISIESLKGMKFYIPNYQRGYRWKPQQAIDLLNDINDFAKKHKNPDNTTDGFYCLQPLVVKERLVDEPGYRDELEKICAEDKGNLLDNTRQVINDHIKWEVIDGQQRLTTIYILLRCLGENDELYTIEYQTRQESADFLRNITNNDSDKNIDYWHMTEVKKAIDKWFKDFDDKKDDKKKEFKDILLNYVKFIWYQSVEKKPIDVFTRLNIGKIRLTNAELIKALFLNRSNFNGDKDEHLKLRQNEISSQWDNIEYTFQNDEFWLFLNPKDYRPITRIELIFNIIYENDLLKIFTNTYDLNSKCGKDEYRLFRYFYRYFSENKDIDIQELWSNKIEPVFNAFNEWYSDIELYHYIGFILAEQTNHQAKIREIYSKWRGCNKVEFKKFLIGEIKGKIKNCKDLDLQYQYEGGNGKLPAKTATRPILLLHNIETIIQQNKKLEEHKKYGIGIFNRFPFHLFKLEKWDVEHISSSSTNREEDRKAQEEILLNCYHFVKEDTQNKIMSFLKKSEDNYEQIKEEIDKELSEEDWSPEDKNKIWNYALLDSSTNRSYGNAVFAAKRRILMAKDRGLKINIEFDNTDKKIKETESHAQSAFIPVCTRNVFLKYYSSVQSSPNYWTKADAEAYRQNILDLLKEKFEVFFSEEGK